MSDSNDSRTEIPPENWNDYKLEELEFELSLACEPLPYFKPPKKEKGMTEEIEEPSVVASPRVYDDQGLESSHVRDAEVQNCTECDTEVWVSPSSLPVLAEGATLICFECLATNHAEELKEAQFYAAPGALREVLDYFGKLH